MSIIVLHIYACLIYSKVGIMSLEYQYPIIYPIHICIL